MCFFDMFAYSGHSRILGSGQQPIRVCPFYPLLGSGGKQNTAYAGARGREKCSTFH